MKIHFKKPFIALAVHLLLLLVLSYSKTVANATSAPVIKIVDAKNGSSTVPLGSDTNPMIPGGFPFTVNVVLEGLAERLFTYQIAVSFDKTRVKCTAASVPKDDPNFVFFGKKMIEGKPDIERANLDGYVFLGASLLNASEPVDVSQGIFCQISFAAIRTGVSTLEIIPTNDVNYRDDTFLWNNEVHPVSFTSQGLSVTVTAAPSQPFASFTFNPANPVSDQEVTFDGSGSFDPDGYITCYSWDFGDGTKTSTINAAVSHVFDKNGVYHVELAVFDNDGFSNVVTSDVLVGKPPSVDYTYSPVKPCPYRGDTVTFDASGSSDPDGYISSYVWDFGDGTGMETSDAVVQHVFDKNGVYHVELTVFDNDGLYKSTIQTIFVGIPPVADFKFYPENPKPDEEATFDAYGDATNRLSYDPDGEIVYAIWDFGDYEITETKISDPTELIVGHTYAVQGGVYTVNLTVFDNDGLYTSVLHDVKVQDVVEERAHVIWEGYATVGITIGAIISVAVWYKRRPEKESEIFDHRVF
jgi:PKD repeat protein